MKLTIHCFTYAELQDDIEHKYTDIDEVDRFAKYLDFLGVTDKEALARQQQYEKRINELEHTNRTLSTILISIIGKDKIIKALEKHGDDVARWSGEPTDFCKLSDKELLEQYTEYCL